MATHRFPCPSCGKVLKVEDETLTRIRASGQGTHCPTCKAPVSVDGVGGSPSLRLPKLPPAVWDDFTPVPSKSPLPPPPVVIQAPAEPVASDFDFEEEPSSPVGQRRRPSSGTGQAVAVVWSVVLVLAFGMVGLLTFLWVLRQKGEGEPATQAQEHVPQPQPTLAPPSDVFVSIRGAQVRAAHVEVLGMDRFDNTPRLHILVGVSNRTATKLVHYDSWQRVRRGVSLADEFGNQYRQTDYGFGSKVLYEDGSKYGADNAAVRPGFVVVDCLVFDAPIKAATTLTLQLPLINVGERESVSLALPTNQIK